MSSRPLLEIRALYKRRAERTPHFQAGIDRLNLHPGEVAGITGPSGCGKSTVLELLALLIRPTGAERFMLRPGQGQEVDLAELWRRNPYGLAAVRRAHLGFVHQAGGLYPFLTVRENIELPLRLNRTAAPAHVDELLAFLGLRDLADALPETLSYGERQRTAVARALAHRPHLILADEPTSALDPDTARGVMQLLTEGARRFHAALLVVSHDHRLLAEAAIPAFAMTSVSFPSPESDAATTCPRDAAGTTIRYVLSLPERAEPAGSDAARASASGAAVPDEPAGHVAGKTPGCLWFLAWKDLLHERALTLCAVLAFAAALTPLMVLGGLRSGVVGLLSQRLLNNPSALAVNPYSSRRYTQEDIAALRDLPLTDFIVPLTRTLASTVRVLRPDRPAVSADVVPTAEGDPLLLRYAAVPGHNGAVITRELARSLPDAGIGQSLTLVVDRRRQGKPEELRFSVEICGVLPDAADWKARVYLPLARVLDMERYRDGLDAGSADSPQTYAGFRMYVTGLDAVIPMRDELKRRGIDAYTFAREVETIQNLQQGLTLTALLVGGVTLAGMTFSLASLTVANVRRKARLFAQSRLMGLRLGELLCLPLVQTALIGAAAALGSLVLYAGTAALINAAAGPWLEPGEHACRLPAVQILVLHAGALGLACLCGLSAGRRILMLQPAEVLRRDA